MCGGVRNEIARSRDSSTPTSFTPRDARCSAASGATKCNLQELALPDQSRIARAQQARSTPSSECCLERGRSRSSVVRERQHERGSDERVQRHRSTVPPRRRSALVNHVRAGVRAERKARQIRVAPLLTPKPARCGLGFPGTRAATHDRYGNSKILVNAGIVAFRSSGASPERSTLALHPARIAL